MVAEAVGSHHELSSVEDGDDLLRTQAPPLAQQVVAGPQAEDGLFGEIHEAGYIGWGGRFSY